MLYINKSLSALVVLAISLAALPCGAAQQAANDRQAEYMVTLPEGTVLPIVFTAYLNTKNSQVGDTVYATTTYPIWFNQKLVIPKGSDIRGTLTEVVRPGRIKGKGKLVIRFDDILLPNGVQRDLTVTFRGIHGPGDEKLDRDSESVDAGASKGEDAGTIATSAATGLSVGTLVGAVSGSTGKGMAIGTGVGAAAGVAQVLLTRGKDLVLEPGTQFDLELLNPLEFSYNELEFTDSELSRARESVYSNTGAPRGAPSGDNRRSWPLPGIGFPRF